MVEGVVAVNRNHREDANQHQALAHDVLDRDIVGAAVVGGEHQDALGEGDHDVPGGGLHDDVAGEVAGEGPAGGEGTGELPELFPVRELAEKQQVGGLLKAEAVFGGEAADEVLDIDAAVVELAVAGDLLAVDHFEGVDPGDVGEPGADALAVFIPEALFHLVGVVELQGDGGVFPANPGVIFAAFH